jgi:integrase
MSPNHPNAPSPTVKIKPAKPYDAFPLFPHAVGQWAKKIRGRTYYFGSWADPDAALARYLDQQAALHAGRKPRPATEGTTIKDACNAFLNHKQARLDAGELSLRTWQGYKAATAFLVQQLGKSRLFADLGPDDFESLRNKLAKKYGPHGLGTAIQCIRSVCKYASDNGLIARPVQFGTSFKKPSKKVVRKHRAEQGPKLFTPDEIHKVLANALVPMKAMVLLAINCGMGNSDLGNLRLSALDLDNGILDYPRPKTGIPRRAVLWPETTTAIKAALAVRPTPKTEAYAGLVFVTRCGDSWAKETAENPISDMFSKLVRRLGINGRKGLGFYTLRRTFRTIADEVLDQAGADYIMGHEVPHMSSVYRQTISDARLKAVSDHVHAWLFPPKSDKPEPKDLVTDSVG